MENNGNGNSLLSLTNEEIGEIEGIIGYTFKSKSLLCKAFTHTSYINENGGESNERLEFLGDRVLNFLVAKELYENTQSEVGDLKDCLEAKISAPPLAAIIEKLRLLKYLKCSKGMELEEKKISDLFEAVLGAMYIDSGSFEPCKPFVDRIEPIKQKNGISLLKEWKEQTKTAVEITISDRVDSQGQFSCVISFSGLKFEGRGKRKKDAEKDASDKACRHLKL